MRPSEALKQQIKEFCNARLAEYKWVRIIEFTEEMPRRSAGKSKNRNSGANPHLDKRKRFR